MKIERMCIACWVTKATCVVLGVVGSIIQVLSVTDGCGGFGGDSSCDGGNSGGRSCVLILFLCLLVCLVRAHDGHCSLLKLLLFVSY
jgi:hypothetical protein